MSYMIDSGIWSSVFAVPASVVDDHIRMCSPLSLKILLVMLRHPGVPVDAGWLSAQLNISPADITDALGYWIGAGIVSDSNRPAVPAPARPEPSAQAPAPAASAPAVVSERKNTETGQKLVTISSRPNFPAPIPPLASSFRRPSRCSAHRLPRSKARFLPHFAVITACIRMLF